MGVGVIRFQRKFFFFYIVQSDLKSTIAGLPYIHNTPCFFLQFNVFLDISYCDFMDEWCMDRISGEYADTLEYLNISGTNNLIVRKLYI